MRLNGPWPQWLEMAKKITNLGLEHNTDVCLPVHDNTPVFQSLATVLEAQEHKQSAAPLIFHGIIYLDPPTYLTTFTSVRQFVKKLSFPLAAFTSSLVGFLTW